jgi:hypothetical protein
MSIKRLLVHTSSNEKQQNVWNEHENISIFAPETKKQNKINKQEL